MAPGAANRQAIQVAESYTQQIQMATIQMARVDAPR
jgi:hypothetical protein